MASRLKPLTLSSGSQLPPILYGTAWKREHTAELLFAALECGFKGFDSANHPTSYREDLNGYGLEKALRGGLKREDIWIQTKFTPAYGHHRGKIPFDTRQTIEGQIRESIEQSFTHLKIQYIDALLLHAPFKVEDHNFEAWEVFASYVPGRIGHLGISNVSLPLLEKIYERSSIKPEIVQNRFDRATSYDTELRAYCQKHGIVYQAFGVLRNKDLLESNVVQRLATKLDTSREIALYVLVIGLGNTEILTGTTNPDTMREDLVVVGGILEDAKIRGDLESFLEEFESQGLSTV